MGDTLRAESGGMGEYQTGAVPPGFDKPTPEDGEEGKLAGKFNSQEDLIEAYKELEKKLGQRSQETPAEQPTEEQPAPDLPEDGTITKATDKAIDVEALTKEFMESGELSDSTYERLSQRGIPREMVDAYVAGQKALADNAVDVLANTVGGRDEFARTLEWASENLTDAEIDAYNDAMKAGNVGATQALLRGIRAAYEADVGQAPRGITGERAGGPAGIQPFRDDAEMNHAIQDPRYKTDPAYRHEVSERIAAMLRR